MSVSGKERWPSLFVALLLAFVVGVIPSVGWAQQPDGEGAEAGEEAPAEGAGEGDPAEGAEGEGQGDGIGEEEAPPAKPPAPKPKVLLLPTDRVDDKVSSLISERVDDQTRKRLKDDGRVVLMPSFSEIRKRLAGQGQSSAVIYEAETLYTQGIGLLTAGENEKALEVFQRSVELMEANLADLQNYEVLADALANLSLAYFLSGFDLDGRKRMKQFAHLRPSATLNPEKYPKDLLEVLAEEQAKVTKAGPGKLIITSNVEGAAVFIDGEVKGQTPATIEDVGFGYHYLVVRDGKGGTFAQQIRVRGKGKEQTIDAQIASAGGTGAVAEGEGDEMPSYYTDLLAQLRTGVFDANELQPYFSELAKQAGAPYLAWILMHKDPAGNYIATPFVWRAEDSTLIQVKDTKFNFELSNLTLGINQMSKDIATALETMPADKAVVQVSLKAAPVVTTTTGTGTDTGTGTGTDTDTKDPVIIAGTGTGTGTGTDVNTTTTLDPPPEVDEETRLKRRKLLRNVGMGTAAAVVVGGLVTGTVLLLSNDSPEDEQDGFSAEVSW